MTHGRRIAASILLVLAGVAGCSSGNNPTLGTQGGNGRPAPPAATSAGAAGGAGDTGNSGAGSGDFSKKTNMVVTAVCTKNSSGGAVQVTGWDTRDWHPLAEALFVLPAPTVMTNVTHELCEQHSPYQVAGEASGIRALFDRDYTRMAVAINAGGESRHVGYVDRSRTFTDLTGDGGFGMTPRETDAAFSADGSTMWFTYEATSSNGSASETHLGSRSVSGDHALVDHWHGESGTEPFVIPPPSGKGPVALGRSRFDSPDGRRMTVGATLFDSASVGPAVNGMSEEKKGKPAVCDPVGWTGPDTLLCDSQDARNLYTAAPDATTPGQNLLPANDHENHGLLISPDSHRFLFASSEPGSPQVSVYLANTAQATPPAAPTKVPAPDSLTSAGWNAHFLEWR
ncbi:hypothetical protein ACFXDE_35320 [Kitasatospora sp. NPDC059408]|uniref:hypothetical protein n=1 Tax=Kitasatospora sp. NPDC059408 TaxID=3346823 RepID=UPI0036B2C80F